MKYQWNSVSAEDVHIHCHITEYSLSIDDLKCTLLAEKGIVLRNWSADEEGGDHQRARGGGSGCNLHRTPCGKSTCTATQTHKHDLSAGVKFHPRVVHDFSPAPVSRLASPLGQEPQKELRAAASWKR